MYEEIFEKISETFMEFLSNQTQLLSPRDLLYGMIYTTISSPDGINTGKASLWKGVLLPENCDAQLNLEFSIRGKTYVQIRHHDKTCNLLSNKYSWSIEEEDKEMKKWKKSIGIV